jgi:hypothetical protein
MQAIALECIGPNFLQNLMENLPLELCEKPKSFYAFARHLSFHYVSQNPFSFVFPTSFVTPSVKHVHVFFKMQYLFLNENLK